MSPLQLGPPVLLETTFLAMTQGQDYKCSKLFEKTLTGVLHQLETTNFDGHLKYHNNRMFIVRLMRRLGGDAVADYLEDFLDEHLDWEDEGVDSEASEDE